MNSVEKSVDKLGKSLWISCEKFMWKSLPFYGFCFFPWKTCVFHRVLRMFFALFSTIFCSFFTDRKVGFFTVST